MRTLKRPIGLALVAALALLATPASATPAAPDGLSAVVHAPDGPDGRRASATAAVTDTAVVPTVSVPPDARASTVVYGRPARSQGRSAQAATPETPPPAGRPAGGLFALLSAAGLVALGTIRAGEAVEGGTIYRTAFQTMSESVPRRIDPSSFIGTDWVDPFGVLKPGTPLKADGTLAGTVDATVAAFVVPFAVGIAAGNTSALLNSAPNGDIAAASRGDLVRANIEAALGRTLTAFEVTAYNASGRFVIL